MGDNICDPNVKDSVPEIYAILSLDKGHPVASPIAVNMEVDE
jgi:hypothetical protein